MSKFTDALNMPLPSKAAEVAESAEDTVATEGELDTTVTSEGDCSGATCEEEDVTSVLKEDDDEDEEEEDKDKEKDDDDDDEDDDDDDLAGLDDIEDLSDDDLAALDAELSGEALDAVTDDDEEEVTLNPEEEIKADDMMKLSATTMLVNDELNAEERASFAESTESAVAVNEGFMTDADVQEMSGKDTVATEAAYNKKMIIRLDAASKKKQLYALAVNVSAAAHHDPDYVKLKKVMKMRKILRKKLEKKYHAEATKRMKVYFARLKNSKSGVLSKLGNKLAK